jgi:beta-phosphoglucomutase-like phosphatase (HAD superfamily)
MLVCFEPVKVIQQMSETVVDFDKYKFLTFDCYGTLVDWEQGILNAIQSVLHRHNVNINSQQLFELFDRDSVKRVASVVGEGSIAVKFVQEFLNYGTKG